MLEIIGVILGWIPKLLAHATAKGKGRREAFAKSVSGIPVVRKNEMFELAKSFWGIWYRSLFTSRRLISELTSGTGDFDAFMNAFKSAGCVFSSDGYISKCNAILNRVDETIHPNAFIGVYSSLNGAEDYHKELRKWLLLKFESAVLRWAGACFSVQPGRSPSPKGEISVLMAGHFNEEFFLSLLSSIADTVHVSRILVKVLDPDPRVARRISDEIATREHLPANIRVVMITSGDGERGFDIVICSHYWQHLSSARWNDFACGKDVGRRVLGGGLLVWASAVSRDEHCEYVSEGLPPKAAYAHDVSMKSVDEAISFRATGRFAKSSRSFVRYSELERILELNLPHGLEFPCSVECEKRGKGGDDAFDFRVCREYLAWKFAKYGLEVCDARRLESYKPVSPEDGAEGYFLMSVARPDRRDRLYFSVIRGVESKTTEVDGRFRRLTFLPAFKIYGFPKERLVMEDVKEKILPQRLMDSRRISDQDIAVSGDGKSARVSSGIDDATSNRYLLLLCKTGEESCLFYSYLPQRRYLTQEMFDAQIKDFSRIEHENLVNLRRKLSGRLVREVSPRSVTALKPFGEIEKALRKRGFEVDEKQIFFYKQYAHLAPGELSGEKSQYSKREGMGFEQAVGALSGACGLTCASDEALNRFSFSKRKALLAPLNVHNVLLFATRKQNLEAV